MESNTLDEIHFISITLAWTLCLVKNRRVSSVLALICAKSAENNVKALSWTKRFISNQTLILHDAAFHIDSGYFSDDPGICARSRWQWFAIGNLGCLFSRTSSCLETFIIILFQRQISHNSYKAFGTAWSHLKLWLTKSVSVSKETLTFTGYHKMSLVALKLVVRFECTGPGTSIFTT